MHRSWLQADVIETARKLYATYETRKRRQGARHVLRKEVVEHAILPLFVSRRNDKSPNGFSCAIRHKDVSLMSRDEPQIWAIS